MDSQKKGELVSFIDKIKHDATAPFFDEAATKQAIILRVLDLLGWNTFDVDEVKPEYSIGGQNVDYSLRLQGKNKVFVEVKKPAEDLENHEEQLLNYSFREGVAEAILTNGLTWWLYLPIQTGSWQERKFYTIDFVQQNSEDAASKLLELVSRRECESGKALENAKEIQDNRKKQQTAEKSIGEAWSKIMNEPDEALIELLADTAEKLSGYRPDNQSVALFISNSRNRIASQGTVPKPEKVKRQVEMTSKWEGQDFTGKTPSGFTFEGTSYRIGSWRELLTEFSEILNKSQGPNFTKVLELRGKKRPYFTLKPNELRSPYRIGNTNISVEINLPANFIVKLCFTLLALFGYPRSSLVIEA
jgi:predicted type IV restriction endonuclease